MNKSASAAVLLSLCLIVGCGEQAVEVQEEIARPVKIITFGGAGDVTMLEYAGTVAAAQRSEMAFEVAGRINEFLVAAGETVQEGQVLARLDPRDFQVELDKAIANRDAAEADFERYDQAFKENAVTRQDVDLARRNLEVSQANLRSAQKAFSDAELKAPFSGVVAQKLVKDFANVQAKQAVLVLEDDSTLEIDVNVPEQDWARARPNLGVEERSARIQARVTVAAIPNRAFPAKLKELDTTADPVTRTYNVTFSFENPTDVSVKPGMTASVVVTVPSEAGAEGISTSTIPSAAVRSDEQGNAFVWRVGEDMRVAKQPVIVGNLSGEQIQILGGLEPGSRIATSGVHNLREGSPVREHQK